MEIQEKNDERYQEFYSAAKTISLDINKHLLTICSGILGALFFLLIDVEKEQLIHEKILLFLAAFCFGGTIFLALQAWHLEGERSYFIGAALDPGKKSEKEKNLERKRSTEMFLKFIKRGVRWFFIMGVFLVLGYLLGKLF